jgi:hypothetical protein
MKLLNSALGDAAILIVDKCEPARPSRIAIGGNDNLNGIADGAEVLPDVGVGRAVWEIANE